MPNTDRWQLMRARHVIIEKCRGERLALIIVRDLLMQRGADTLHHAAPDLTSTSIGLTIVPQSSATAKSSNSIAPVSGSTATTAPWVAYE